MPDLDTRFRELVQTLGIAPPEDQEVTTETAHCLTHPGLEDPSLRDETQVPYVTIDNTDSRDLDQALHVSRNGDAFVLRYALADASYFVTPGSALWNRSLALGSSYYLPGLTLPMLPKALSEGLISLNPDGPRRALVFRLAVNPDGQCTSREVYRAKVFSRAKLAYSGVQRWYDSGFTGDPRCEASGVRESLIALGDLGRARLAEASSRGVVSLHHYEAQVDRDPNNLDRLVAITRERNDIERWNEQLSLLCNIEGAALLREETTRGETVQPVFRVHLPPLEERLDELEAILDTVASRRSLGDRWSWRAHHDDLSEWVASLPSRGASTRLTQAIERQVRYTYRASEFQARSGPHHALGVDAYARVTAPMREAVGIFTHKELLEGLGLVAPRPKGEDISTRTAVIASANEARRLQGEIDKAVDLMVLEQLFSDDLALPIDARPWRLGTIVGVRSTRLYVSLDGCAVDVKIYVEDLEASYETRYTDDRRAALVADAPTAPSFIMGDAVLAQVKVWNSPRARYVISLRPAV